MNPSNNWIFRYSDSYEWMDRVRQGLPPLIITCAVNGGFQGQESHPALPESPGEIADEVAGAYAAGASVVHIHPRDRKNLAITARTADEFREVNRLVRQACPNIVINNSTGMSLDANGTTYYEILDARPEMASLNLGPDMVRLMLKERPGSMAHPRPAEAYDETVPWTYGRIEELARWMKEREIKPELETYHSGQFWVSQNLISQQLIEPPYVHQLVMGYQTGAYATPTNILNLLTELPNDSLFFAAGIGAFQPTTIAMAVLLGGHVRVGLEDNLYLRRGTQYKNNAEVVERVVRIAGELGREVATPQLARSALGLSKTPRAYS